MTEPTDRPKHQTPHRQRVRYAIVKAIEALMAGAKPAVLPTVMAKAATAASPWRDRHRTHTDAMNAVRSAGIPAGTSFSGWFETAHPLEVELLLAAALSKV